MPKYTIEQAQWQSLIDDLLSRGFFTLTRLKFKNQKSEVKSFIE